MGVAERVASGGQAAKSEALVSHHWRARAHKQHSLTSRRDAPRPFTSIKLETFTRARGPAARLCVGVCEERARVIAFARNCARGSRPRLKTPRAHFARLNQKSRAPIAPTHFAAAINSLSHGEHDATLGLAQTRAARQIH